MAINKPPSASLRQAADAMRWALDPDGRQNVSAGTLMPGKPICSTAVGGGQGA
jgi:hypothetical protein